jgi:hypothetical protein
MTMTMNAGSNGKVRKSLASQLDRLDTMLDGLAEGLQEAVADAVKTAVEVAVKEVLQAVLTEVLTNTDLAAKLRGQPAPTKQEAVAPVRPRGIGFGLWKRLGQLCQGVRDCLRDFAKWSMMRMGQAGSWVGGVWQKTVEGVVSAWRQRRVVTQFKYQLLAALGVGGAVATGAWCAGPWLSVLLSGLGGFAASVAVQGWLWLRNALGLQVEQAA